MALNLGAVNFGLGADTAGLQKAVRQLQKFGQEVDRVANSQAKGAQAAVAQYARQEQAVRQAHAQVTQLNAQLRAAGAPASELARTTNAFKNLTMAMTSGKLNAVDFARAQDRYRLSINKTQAAVKHYTSAQRTATTRGTGLLKNIRDLESASVLAVGPLSGLGARISALGSIASRGSLGIALFFGAITGGLVGLFMLVKGAISARRELEQIEVAFEAALGSAAAARAEFEYVTQVTDRMGIELNSTARAYSRLVAASATTIITQQELRNLFEGTAAAASVFNLTAQDTEGVMVALEQMMSKGVVSSEELRKQFATRIPGSFRLAAEAMGMTEGAFNRMLARGEILSVDLLPRLGQKLQEAFGENALKAAGNMESSIQRLSGEAFRFSIALDGVIKASVIFQNAVDALSGSIKFLRQNLQTVGTVAIWVGTALLGAFASRGLIGAIRGLVKAIGVTGLVGALRTAAAAGGGLTGRLIAIGRFGVGGPIFALVGTIAALAAGFYNARKNARELGAEQQNLRDQLEGIANFGEDPTALMAREAESALMQAKLQMEDYEEMLQRAMQRQNELVREASQNIPTDVRRRAQMLPPDQQDAFLSNFMGKEVEEQATFISHLRATLLELREGYDAAEQGAARMRKELEGTPALSSEAEKAIKKLADQVREYQNASRIAAQVQSGASLDAIQSMQDLHAAQAALKDVPTAEIEQVRLSLVEMGIAGDNVYQMIARVISGQRAHEQSLEDYRQAIQGGERALEDMHAKMTEMDAFFAAQRGGTQSLRDFFEFETLNREIADYREQLTKAGMDQTLINQEVDAFRAKSIAYAEARDDAQELVQMLNEAPAAYRAMAAEMVAIQAETNAMNEGVQAYQQHLRRIETQDVFMKQFDAALKLGLSIEQASIWAQGYLKIWEENRAAEENLQGTLDLVQTLQKGIERAMDDVGQAITSAFVRGEDSAVKFENVVKSVLQSIMQAVTRAAFVKPLTDMLSSFIGGAMGGGGAAAGGAGATGAAKGGVWGAGVKRFAKGGVVNTPTFFNTQSRRGGLMGEAGPEAIMPLKRTGSGELGVQVSGAGGGTTIIMEGDNIDARNMTPETLAQLMPVLERRDRALEQRIMMLQSRRRER